MNKKFGGKKFNGVKSFAQPSKEQTYLQTRLTLLMPILMEKITQTQEGMFVFAHETFPDLRVEGLTLSFMEEHIERAIKRQFRGQSNKHIDYLFNLLIK